MSTKDIVIGSQASIEKGDLEMFLKMVEGRTFNTALEIGTWKGFSAQVWLQAFTPKTFITLEKDRPLPDAVWREYPGYHYLWETDSTLEATRERVKELLGGQPIDFMFLDGSHYYHDVLREWQLYVPLMAHDGVIAMHDVLYTAPECTVNVLWEKIKRRYHYAEINCGAGSTGFGVVFLGNGELTVANKTREIEYWLR